MSKFIYLFQRDCFLLKLYIFSVCLLFVIYFKTNFYFLVYLVVSTSKFYIYNKFL